jgi:nicotinate-nucleotide adenylyltransferase
LRIGLFGGAFNPPHAGHLVCAQEAHAQLGLDTVVWMPVGQAPHRELPDDPGREARAEMCGRAIAGDERFELSRIEVEREGPSYTADTLRELGARSPDAEIVLILGGDQAAALARWHRPEAVAELAALGVAERADGDRARVEAALRPYGARVEFFDMPRIGVSSTMLRARVAAGGPIRYLVPDAVAGFIAERNLYAASIPA